VKTRMEILIKIKNLEMELKDVHKHDRGGLANGILILKLKGLINALKWVIDEAEEIII
jgi:hypothetical protein